MCAIGVGNAAYCWGKNANGELGIGYASNDALLAPGPVVVGNHAFADIAGGAQHACALTTAGSAYCWGVGTYGALGDGRGTNSAEPRAVAGNHVFKTIGVGDLFACGLTADGQAYCWGANNNFQLGTTTENCLTYSVRCSEVPVAVGGGYVFEFLALGRDRACGVTATNDIYCWGWAFGATPSRFRSVLASEPGGVGFRTVALGVRQTCAISTTGDAWCASDVWEAGVHSVQQPTLVPGGVKFRTP